MKKVNIFKCNRLKCLIKLTDLTLCDMCYFSLNNETKGRNFVKMNSNSIFGFRLDRWVIVQEGQTV